jgi:hypothetical protein
MTRRFAVAAIIWIAWIVGVPDTARTATLSHTRLHYRGHGTEYHHSIGVPPLGLRHFGAGSGSGGLYTGDHYGGSGWYPGGFGGTLNPGWDYRFGPALGGLGH